MSEVKNLLENLKSINPNHVIEVNGVFCSVIIPTIGRSTLERSVMSVLEQDFKHSDFEVIVVNDSGKPLQKARWQDSAQVRIINTNKRERSNARNSGAALAKGKYLAFLDDDDWILPDALNSFWQLAQQQSKAAWLYGGLQIVDGYGEILTELNSSMNGNCFAQIMGGGWAPIQSSLVSSKVFFHIGGFNPNITVTEDLDLCRRFAYVSEFVNTPDIVACLSRGESWNTSSNYLLATDNNKKSRDYVLSQPAAFSRLIDSAKTPYWFGRILRVYLSTITWNIERWRWFTAVSRFIYSLFVIIRANMHTLSRDFWAGLKAEHVPGTLHFVMEEYEKEHAKN